MPEQEFPHPFDVDSGDDPLDDMFRDPPDPNSRDNVPHTSGGHGRRGTHTRTSEMGARSKWVPWVQAHMESFGRLLTTAFCGERCPGCDTKSFATTRLAEDCARESFGEAALDGVFEP